MAVEACVRRIVCALAVPVRNMLQALYGELRLFYQGRIAILQAYLLKTEILLAPVILAEEGIAVAKQAVRAGLVFIDPLAEAGQACLELGEIVNLIEAKVDVVDAEVAAVTNDLRRLLSVKEDIQALIEELNQNLLVIDDFIEALGSCV